MRQSKLLFYGKLAEKALQTYERDGWGEFPTQIVVERREIRPTADRGPILLCVDTSGDIYSSSSSSSSSSSNSSSVYTAPSRVPNTCQCVVWHAKLSVPQGMMSVLSVTADAVGG